MEQRRDNTVTYVKALGIILMVVSHVLSSNMVVRKAIFTFHMPLFFLMSGYCFKEKYLDDGKQFLIRKIKGIYVPFVLFSLPFLAMHNVFCHWHIYDPDWLYGWKDFAWNTGRIVTRMSHNEGLLGTFWFLKELLWGNLIFYATYRLIKWVIGNCKMVKGNWKLGAEWVTIIGLFVLTEIACIFQLRVPYFGIGKTSLYSAFFIAFGYLWKKSAWDMNKWWIWVVGVTLVIAEAVLVQRTMAVDSLTPLSLIYYATIAIFGTMVVFEVSRRIDNSRKSIVNSLNRGLRFIGEHTLSVMALHFTAFKLVSLGYILVYGLSMERLEDFPVMRDMANTGGNFVLYAFIGLFVPLILAWLWLKIKAEMQTLKGVK